MSLPTQIIQANASIPQLMDSISAMMAQGDSRIEVASQQYNAALETVMQRTREHIEELGRERSQLMIHLNETAQREREYTILDQAMITSLKEQISVLKEEFASTQNEAAASVSAQRAAQSAEAVARAAKLSIVALEVNLASITYESITTRILGERGFKRRLIT